MVNNIKIISQEEKKRRRGSCAGRMAANSGCNRAIFRESDGRSIFYKNAYNKSYDKAATSSPEEKKCRRAEALGKQDARRGKPKRGFTDTHKTPEYINSYTKGYESIGSFSKNQQQLQDHRNGIEAGKQAALRGDVQVDLSEKSSEYNEGFKMGYEKYMALSDQEKQAKNGKFHGRISASINAPRYTFKAVDPSPTYQKAHLQAYDNYFLKKSKTSSLADTGPSDANSIQCIADLHRTKESALLQSPSVTDCMEGEEFALELFNGQQSSSPLPYLPNISTPGPECSIGYFEGQNSPQEPSADLNSMEELGHYLDSLNSQMPPTHTGSSLPPQGQDTSLSFDAVVSNSEFNPQQSLSPLPCFPNFSTPDPECSISYFEGLNPPQEPSADINSMEGLGRYLDSLNSQTPPTHTGSSLPPQDNGMSLNFDAVGDLLGVYKTIQPTQWKSRVYPIPQPLFFSVHVPVPQTGSTQEASIPSMADWVNKKI